LQAWFSLAPSLVLQGQLWLLKIRQRQAPLPQPHHNMTQKHAIIFGLLAGANDGYVFADKLVTYQPYTFVAQKVASF
jgi:hypothetical protein